MNHMDISWANARHNRISPKNAEYLILCSTEAEWSVRQKELLSRLLSHYDSLLQLIELGHIAEIQLTDYGTCAVKIMTIDNGDATLDSVIQLLDQYGIDEDEGFYRRNSNADCVNRIRRCLEELARYAKAV